MYRDTRFSVFKNRLSTTAYARLGEVLKSDQIVTAFCQKQINGNVIFETSETFIEIISFTHYQHEQIM